MKRLRRHFRLLFAGLLLAAGHAGAAAPAAPQVLYSFCPDHAHCFAGQEPLGLVRGRDGAYYGITFYGGLPLGGGVIYRVDPATRAVRVVHRFDPDSEGYWPNGWLAIDANGNFYGALLAVGELGFGRIFRLTPGGDFTVLHASPDNISHADSPPVRDRHGNWYGTMYGYPSSLYEIDASGVYRTLHTFPQDGSNYVSAHGLVLAPDGYLYGTTAYGGDYHMGTVFRMSRDGTSYTTLHHFDGITDGFPLAAPTLGADGALYGTSWLDPGASTMFRITTDGQFATLNIFGLEATGAIREPLTLMPDGYFYGTRPREPNGPVIDIIFRLSPTGEYSELYTFPSNRSRGYTIHAPLIRGFDNALYGTAQHGGKNDSGTLFRYVPPPAE
jgi:uncharacterized repeat protein (TIGR03803 family)